MKDPSEIFAEIESRLPEGFSLKIRNKSEAYPFWKGKALGDRSLCITEKNIYILYNYTTGSSPSVASVDDIVYFFKKSIEYEINKESWLERFKEDFKNSLLESSYYKVHFSKPYCTKRGIFSQIKVTDPNEKEVFTTYYVFSPRSLILKWYLETPGKKVSFESYEELVLAIKDILTDYRNSLKRELRDLEERVSEIKQAIDNIYF